MDRPDAEIDSAPRLRLRHMPVIAEEVPRDTRPTAPGGTRRQRGAHVPPLQPTAAQPRESKAHAACRLLNLPTLRVDITLPRRADQPGGSPERSTSTVKMHLWFLGGLLMAGAANRGSGESEPKRRASDCVGCHTFVPQLTHPIGVTPRGPTALPLTSGTVDCATCHDAAALSGHESQGARGRFALRQPAVALCRTCHGTEAAPGSRTAHGLLIGRAHLTQRASVPAMPGPDGGRLDGETHLCLPCHDGSAASAVGLGGPGVPAQGIRLAGSHPIGRIYDDLRPGRGRLRPRMALPPELRLVDGRIGCGTCHSPYAHQPMMLPIDDYRSRLCLTCHVK